MVTAEKVDLTPIIKRLDAILHILMKQVQVQDMSARDHIGILNSIGLSDIEIAGILGRSRGYVASELTQIRKKEGK